MARSKYGLDQCSALHIRHKDLGLTLDFKLPHSGWTSNWFLFFKAPGSLIVIDYRLIDERFGQSEPSFDGHGECDASGAQSEGAPEDADAAKILS